MLINSLAICLLFCAVVNPVSVNDILGEEWNLFKIKYRKSYKTLFEEEFRFKIFIENKYQIAIINNKLFIDGKVTYETGINHLSDMLPNEIVTPMSGLAMINDLEVAMNEIPIHNFTIDYDVPSNFDWRSKGAVTGVRDQGQCYSSWAFAAIGVVESQQVIKRGKNATLSPQNLIDCSKENGECHGGWPIRALQYIRKNNGVDTEHWYPYTGNYSKTCKYKREYMGATVHDIRRLPKHGERKLKTFIYKYGPVAVSINATDPGFKNYKSGVYDNVHCSKLPNHSALIVGYGSEKGHAYWLVKNSWGIHWGNAGYIKIARNKNMCGIGDYGVFPLI